MIEVEKLKQKILDLAIRGKLVPQDPNDEPASVLIEKIKKEKEQLVKEGKIKASKNDSYIYKGSDNCYYEKIGDEVKNIDDEIPFEIPDLWCFARLGTVMDVRDGTHDTPTYQKEGIPFVTSKNIVNGSIDFSTCKYISKQDADHFNKRSAVDDGDILLAMIGTIGKPIIVKKDREFSIKNIALLKTINPDLLEPTWIKLILDSYVEKMRYEASGGLQPFVSLTLLRNLIVPIAPGNEIQRLINNIFDTFDFIEKILTEEKELTTLISKTKNKLLETIFSENSSYKSYYKNYTPFEEDVEIFDNLRKPINRETRLNRISKTDVLYPYYGSTGQTGLIDEYIFEGEYVLLGEDGAPFLDKGIAKAYIVNGKFWVNNHAHVLKSKTNNKFLKYYLDWVDYSNYVTGTTRLKLNQKMLKKIMIPNMPKNTKEMIVGIIETTINCLNKISN